MKIVRRRRYVDPAAARRELGIAMVYMSGAQRVTLKQCLRYLIAEPPHEDAADAMVEWRVLRKAIEEEEEAGRGVGARPDRPQGDR